MTTPPARHQAPAADRRLEAGADDPAAPVVSAAQQGLGRRRALRGGGTLRERRPSVWEIRIPAEPDHVTGRARRLSITVHGTRADAETERRRLLAWAAERPYVTAGGDPDAPLAPLPPPIRVEVGQLLTA